MRAGFYWRYATRALRRGGQRTVLAIFCIAVGVMAVVALQLASLMVSANLTSNVRVANGGDISVHQEVVPFRPTDLAFFMGLRHDGLADRVTALVRDRGVAFHGINSYPVVIGAVDPAQYPLVGEPAITRPAHARLRALLSVPGAVVLSQSAATSLHVTVGDRITANGGAGRTVTARVAGLAASGGLTGGLDVYVAVGPYARSSGAALTYQVVYVTTPGDAQTRTATDLIRRRYPLATVETVADALQARQQQTQLVRELLQVVGILALLIGGFGVVNTMNVMLARRRVEIAMLKTAGYRRRDLYALFGLEATLLGLAGGAVGSVLGTGLSWGVKSLIENAFLLQLPFVVDRGSVAMGVAVGLCTAIIFGLLPIVRAAAVRPQAVLRASTESAGWAARGSAAGLVVLLGLLFCILASVILGSIAWAIGVVAGAFVALTTLGLIFAALVWVIGALPVPERLNARQVLLSTVLLIIAVATLAILPAVGAALLALALLGFVIPFLPPPWKVAVKLSLRNIARQRVRATMTLLALFVGVFSVGLMVVLGQDVRDKIGTALASLSDYNVATVAPARWSYQVDRQLTRLPGLRSYQTVNAVQVVPVAVNGRSIYTLLLHARPRGRRRFGQRDLGVNGTLAFLFGVGGYNLGKQPTAVTIRPGDGRDLTSADAGSSNVLLNVLLHRLGPLHLRVGDRVTLLDQARMSLAIVTVVGFYTAGPFGDASHFEPVLAPRQLVHRISAGDEQIIYSLKVDTAHVDAAVARLNRAAPHAITINLTSLGALVDQILGNLVILLVALASLALFAGVIIIANAVALAMLERRREQGILKAVGYTGRRILTDVLIENGVIGGLAGVLGVVVVAIATAVLSRNVFKTDLGMPLPTTLALITLVTVIALVTAGLVSWAAVRVRPLDVLRYE